MMDASKEKIWAVIGHLGGLVPVFLMPVLIPLVIWLLKGDESVFIDRQAKEALNFQISLFIYSSICILLVFTIIGIPIAWLAWIVFYITNIICSITGAVRTFKGHIYNYPMNLRLIK